MRILFVAEAVEGSRSLQRYRALEAMGHAVLFVPTTPLGHSCEARPSLIQRLRYRLRVPADAAGVNDTLLGLDARAFDLAFFDNAKTVRGNTLAALRARNPAMPLVWFAEDDLLNPRHRTLWLAGSIPLYDLMVTTKSFNADPFELPRLGARRVLFVDNAFDPALHRPIAVDADERVRFGADIGFVGTFEAPRAASLLALAEAGLSCRVWGNGWQGLIGRHPGLVVENRPVYGPDYARVLASCRINLCFLRHFNRDRQTTRSIEIPASGAFMVHEHSDEMTRLLRPDTEAVYFADDRELVASCRFWLADDAGRAAIAAAGKARVQALGLEHAGILGRILAAVQEAPQ